MGYDVDNKDEELYREDREKNANYKGLRASVEMQCFLLCSEESNSNRDGSEYKIHLKAISEQKVFLGSRPANRESQLGSLLGCKSRLTCLDVHFITFVVQKYGLLIESVAFEAHVKFELWKS